MNFLSTITNLIMIILFVRLCAQPDRETFFNPFVSASNSKVNRITDILSPLLALPERAIIVLLLLFVFLFKSLLVARLGQQVGVSFGEAFKCVPPPNAAVKPYLLVFSFLESISFLLKFWSFHFLTTLIATPLRSSRTSQALNYYTQPYSKLPFIFKPFFLVGAHIILAFIATNLGVLTTNALQPNQEASLTTAIITSSFPINIIKTAALGVLAFVQGISVMISALFACIIGSLLATFMRRPAVMLFCREGTDLILGRFANNRAVQTGLDFTPLIFFIVANLIYNAVNVFIFTFINMNIELPF